MQYPPPPGGLGEARSAQTPDLPVAEARKELWLSSPRLIPWAACITGPEFLWIHVIVRRKPVLQVACRFKLKSPVRRAPAGRGQHPRPPGGQQRMSQALLCGCWPLVKGCGCWGGVIPTLLCWDFLCHLSAGNREHSHRKPSFGPRLTQFWELLCCILIYSF